MSGQIRIITNDDYNEPFWKDDFYLKHEIIRAKYKISTQEDLYIAQAGSLDTGCTLLIEELPIRKVQKVSSYYEVLPYLDKYKKVLIYCKEFNKPSSVAMRFLEYLNGFVIDLDEVRSYNIEIALDKIDRCPLKPNFIVNSGNGLHLYFIFKEKFDFMNYTSGMAFLRRVKRVKVTGRKKKKYVMTTADKIKDIYAEMLKWFDDPSYKTDKLHLAHGIRMFGGKTKNSQVTSTIYKGSEDRYDLETLAEITGIELLTQDEQEKYHCVFGSDTGASDISDEVESDINDIVSVDISEICDIVLENNLDVQESSLPCETTSTTKTKIDYKGMSDRFNQFVIDHIDDFKPKRTVPKWTAYNYLVSSVREYNYVGIRNDCLFIMGCQGKLYQIPETVVRKDLEEMAAHMSAVTPTDPITPDDIEKAFNGYFSYYRYTNDTITKITGIPFGKKQKEIRAETRQSNSDEVQRMLDIVDNEYSMNPNIAQRTLSDVLKSHGIVRGKTFLSTDPDVIAVRNKYRVVDRD